MRRVPDQPQAPAPPEHIVERFLQLLCLREIDAAAEVLGADVVYTNVSLPTVRGRERVRRLAQATLGRDGAGLEIYLRAISSRHGKVLTERTDVLTFGPLRIQFWVCGRFDVEGEEIVGWRDYFDWLDFTRATVRGLLGVLLPALRAKAPAKGRLGAS
jgi:limonene-1,2-epoxide hydrolase